MKPYVDLIVTLRAHEGHLQALHEALLQLRTHSLGERGCLDYRIAQASTANTFYLLERWADSTALKQHEQTLHYLDGVKQVQACCESVDIQQVSWCE